MAFEKWKFGGGGKNEEGKKPEQSIELNIPNRLSEFPVRIIPETTETALKLMVKNKQPFFFYLNPESGEVLVSIHKIEGMETPISGEVTLSGTTITEINYFGPEKADLAIEAAQGPLKTAKEQFLPVLELLLGTKLSERPSLRGTQRLEDKTWQEEQDANQ
jgi:hypothetical protein